MQTNYVRASKQAMLTDSDILDMRDAAAVGNVTAAEVAALYGINPSTAARAMAGRSWSHVPSPRPIYKGKYSVYPDGRIRSNANKQFLTPRTGKDGIPTVQLTVNGSRETTSVAYLVAKAFISPSLRSTAKISFIGDTSDTHFTNLSVRTSK